MKLRVVLAVLLVCTAVSVLVCGAEEEAKPSPITLGVGGTFFTNLMGGAPGLDFYVQYPLGEVFAVRGNVTVLAAVQGVFLALVEGAGVLRFGGEGFSPYFGGGAGLFMAVGQGQAFGMVTFNLLGGAEVPLGDQFGLFGQIRLMGVFDPPMFDAFYGPSIGIYIRI